VPHFESYSQWAEEVAPRLHAALEGRLEIPQQAPFSEAWLGYSLFYYNRLLSLEEVIESADAINHGIPNPDEIAWAFLRLRNRGWLVVQEDSFGLSTEGRREIDTIVSHGNLRRLTDWISTHPPPSE